MSTAHDRLRAERLDGEALRFARLWNPQRLARHLEDRPVPPKPPGV